MIIRTPLLQFSNFDNNCNAKIYLKPENLQPLGSYKIRGIKNIFDNVILNKFKDGISAASAGNMGQSIAFFAKKNQIPCSIYVPDTTPEIKKNKIKQFKANLIELPFVKLWQFIKSPPKSTDSFFVHPVFTPPLLEGYQQIAAEIIQDLPKIDAIVIPIGIGGLAIAVSQFIRSIKPDIAIFLAEPITAAPFKAALKHKKPIIIQPRSSFVDAIGTPEILPEVYATLSPLITDSEVVDLEQISDVLKILLQEHKLLCEGAAACSVAAALNIAARNKYQNIVAILTGGNLPFELITKFMA